MNIQNAVSVFLLGVLLAACGGGGGGGNTVTYSGLTDQATVTSANAEDMALGAYALGVIGASPTVVGAVQDSVGHKPRVFSFLQSLSRIVQSIEIESSQVTAVGALERDAGNLDPGSCGGGGTYDLTIDDVTGDFSGSMTFKNMCELGIVFSGKNNVSGNINPSTSEFTSFEISTNALTISACGEALTLAGSVNNVLSGATSTISMNIRVQDNGIGTVYKLDPYTVVIVEGSGFVDISQSGSYFDPAYGFVAISTPTPLRILDADYWPSQGVILATGTGSTKARFTAFVPSYQIEADADGNGTYEFLDTIAWPDDTGCPT